MGISKRFVAKNGLDNNNNTVTNVADPVNAQDVATKNFASNASNLSSGTIPDARLSNTGVSAGTYTKVTVDAKGRVTGSSSLTTSDLPSSISVGDGTAAAPSIAFTSDTDTGIYKPTTNAIAITTAGAEKIRVDESGNVGLGTIAPQAKLDVNGNISISGAGRRITGDFSNATVTNRVVFQSSSLNSATSLTTAPSGTSYYANYTATNSSDVANASVAQFAITDLDASFRSSKRGTGTFLPLTFWTSDTERMRIDTGGRLLLGATSAPASSAVRQVISGGSANYIEFIDMTGNKGSIIGSNGDAIQFFSSTGALGSEVYTERMRIDSDGSLLHATTTKPSFVSSGLLNGSGNICTFNSTNGVGSVIAFGGTGTTSAPYVRFRQDALESRIDSGATSGATFTPLTFWTNGTEKMRIDLNGNVGIGSNNPAGWDGSLVVQRASGTNKVLVVNSGSTVGDVSQLAASAGGKFVQVLQYGNGNSYVFSSGDSLNVGTTTNAPLIFYSYNTERMRLTNDGNFIPSPDATLSLGIAANRWSTVYASTGAINTSDAREKTEVRELNAAELTAAKQIAKEIGGYKFLSSIAEKGDAAREHIGLTVQKAIEIMTANGLDPFNYGFICYDEWTEQTETIPAVEAKESVLDDDGNVIEEAVEAKPEEIKVIQEAGNRYAFRYDELNQFIIRGLAAQLESIEARLSALEA